MESLIIFVVLVVVVVIAVAVALGYGSARAIEAGIKAGRKRRSDREG